MSPADPQPDTRVAAAANVVNAEYDVGFTVAPCVIVGGRHFVEWHSWIFEDKLDCAIARDASPSARSATFGPTANLSLEFVSSERFTGEQNGLVSSESRSSLSIVSSRATSRVGAK
jgi:hypothetical protein